MRKAYCVFLLLIGTGGGCFSLPPTWPANKAPVGPPVAQAVKAGPVTPDQVNEQNARAQANALSREIDLDVNAEVSGMTPADAQAKRDQLNKKNPGN
jgi:hypothetical protein